MLEAQRAEAQAHLERARSGVETAEERQTLMFRVKANIDRELLQKHVRQVKTGLPGVAYVRIDRNAAWPEHLAITLPP